MFKTSKPFNSFSVDDINVAKEFYSNLLELDVKQDEMGLAIKLNGGGEIFVYPKPNHQPASYTVLNFPVENVDEAVGYLKERGIVFEKYDTDHLKTDQKDICRGKAEGHGPDIAWFKDPAGNFLSVLSN